MKSKAFRDQERQCLVDSRWAYRGRVVNLRLDTYKFGEKTRIAEIIQHPGAVVIVPIDAKGRILLVQQWRRAAGEITIELPAGTLEVNEQPDRCAMRELQEETGFAAKKLTSLGGFFSAPGFCDEYLHVFAAEDLHVSPLPPDDDEEIDLLPTPLSDLIQMIKEDKIRDAKTMAAFYKYQLWKSK